MNFRLFSLLVLTIGVIFFACKKEDVNAKANTSNFKVMDTIASNKYYAKDIMPDSMVKIYGNWKLLYISGGFSGDGIANNFEYLAIKKNGIFGIIRNDSLISSGKITLTEFESRLLLNFLPDKPVEEGISSGNKSFAYFSSNDSLYLSSPCCEGLQYGFVRQK